MARKRCKEVLNVAAFDKTKEANTTLECLEHVERSTQCSNVMTVPVFCSGGRCSATHCFCSPSASRCELTNSSFHDIGYTFFLESGSRTYRTVGAKCGNHTHGDVCHSVCYRSGYEGQRRSRLTERASFDKFANYSSFTLMLNIYEL